MLTLGCAIGFGYMAWQLKDPRNAPLTKLLLQRPRDISWVYVEQIDSRAAGVTVKNTRCVNICTIAKKTLTLQASNRHIDALVEALQAFLPDATFGYDKQTHKRYKADPTSLLSAV